MGKLLRVLMLEDSETDAERAALALRSAGWEVDWRRAETAESFTQALENQGWDVILADFAGRGCGAGAALEQVKRRTLDLPFLVVSTSIGEEAAITLIRAGAADFINKEHLGRLGEAVERGLRKTGRRQTEDAQRVLAERWQLLLDHTSNGVAVHQAVRDPDGDMADFRYLEWNRAAERMFHLTRQQVVGRTGSEVLPLAAYKGLMVRFVRAMQTGVIEKIEGYQTRSTEPPRVLDISCIKLDSEHFATVFRDVSERQKSEQRLREYSAEVALANQALEKANTELEGHNAELEEFAHVASHDLQEPLRKVVSFGDLLSRALGDKLDPKCAQYLALMQDAARRLQTLIRDLLAMSRIGRAPLKREPIGLEQCVQAALDLLSARLQETGAAVDIDPLPTLAVDLTQICQLYQNLVSNALKFGATDRKPEIRITCEIEPDGPVLGVADNGIGIEPEYHEKIFEAFQRLHSRDRYEGSGTGLAVCRKIVTRHGGTIWVESRLGEGSHFRFRLGPVATKME